MMVKLLKEQHALSTQAVEDLLLGENLWETRLPESDNNRTILHTRDGKPIRAKTVNQRKLVEATEHNDIVFAVGPAGTGKTYTAVALAVRALKNRKVKKIILTRPGSRSGGKFGFFARRPQRKNRPLPAPTL